MPATLDGVTTAPVAYRKLTALADVPHPFPYQGSKRALAHAIVPLLPDDASTLIEPFCGSAALAIAARHTKAADSTVLNDVNAPLIGLWDRILDDPGGLADEYEAMWHDQQDDPRAFYEAAREKFNASHDPALLLYLLNRCVKAAVRYSRTGDFNQSADHRRLGAKPKVTRARLVSTSATMAGTRTHSGDYAPLLVDAPSDAVVYMDPPYQGVTNVADHRYMQGLTREDFEIQLREAVRRKVSFIVSYDVVTESNRYGEPISDELGLTHLHINAGRSSQATLIGESTVTVESLYLSPALVERLGGPSVALARLHATAEENALF